MTVPVRLLLFTVLSLLLLSLPVYATGAEGEKVPLTLLKKPGSTSQNSQAVQPQGLSSQGMSMQGSPNQAEQLHDIHGPVPIIEQPPYLLLGGLLLLVLLLAGLFFWWWKKREKPAAPPIPPWEKALLDLADARRLLNPERGLQYMDRASQILRHYIESRFAIKSTRQTTREFLHSLTDNPANSGTPTNPGNPDNLALMEHKTELRACLEEADMAKFAHHVSGLSNLENMEEAVTSFINNTEPLKANSSPAAATSPSAVSRAQELRS